MLTVNGICLANIKPPYLSFSKACARWLFPVKLFFFAFYSVALAQRDTIYQPLSSGRICTTFGRTASTHAG